MQISAARPHLLSLPLKGRSPLGLLLPQRCHLLRRQLHPAGVCWSLVLVRAVLICRRAAGCNHTRSFILRRACFACCNVCFRCRRRQRWQQCFWHHLRAAGWARQPVPPLGIRHQPCSSHGALRCRPLLASEDDTSGHACMYMGRKRLHGVSNQQPHCPPSCE